MMNWVFTRQNWCEKLDFCFMTAHNLGFIKATVETRNETINVFVYSGIFSMVPPHYFDDTPCFVLCICMVQSLSVQYKSCSELNVWCSSDFYFLFLNIFKCFLLKIYLFRRGQKQMDFRFQKAKKHLAGRVVTSLLDIQYLIGLWASC